MDFCNVSDIYRYQIHHHSVITTNNNFWHSLWLPSIGTEIHCLQSHRLAYHKMICTHYFSLVQSLKYLKYLKIAQNAICQVLPSNHTRSLISLVKTGPK